MSTILVTCMLVPALFSSPQIKGTIARTMAPDVVVHEMVQATDFWKGAPQWVEHGIIGMPASEVLIALGPPQEIMGEAGNETWQYLAGNSGKSTRHMRFEIQAGKVTGILKVRMTGIPPGPNGEMGAILMEF